MAVLRGFVPLTLDNSGSGSSTGRDFDVVEATSDNYVLFDGFITEAYRGMFTYDARGEADGLLNALFISGGDQPFLEIRGLQKDFQTYAGLETDPDNGQLAYLLSGDDVVIGTAPTSSRVSTATTGSSAPAAATCSSVTRATIG